MSDSGKATLENSIKGDIDLELGGKTEQVQTTGAQLFEASWYEGVTKNGVTVTVKDGVITATGTTETDIWIPLYVTAEEYKKLFKPGEKIYIKTQRLNGCNYDFGIYGSFGSPTLGVVKENRGGVTLPTELPTTDKSFYFFLDVKRGTALKGSIKPIVYHDGNGTYEPYTGGKPSPSSEYPQEIKNSGKWNEEKQKYEIDIILNGSNLWNEKAMIRGHITANGEIVYKEDDSNCIWTVVAPRDGKYAVRIEKESVGGLYFTRIFSDKTSEPYVRLNPGQKGVLTLKKGENKIQASSTSALRPIGNEKVMLSYGDQEPPTYEPYQEPQTLTLTSDRPITKWDKLVEQGGQYGWLYKHRIVNNLSALVKDSEPIYGKDGEKYFSVSLQGALFNYDYNKIYSVAGMCPKDSKIYYVPKPMIQSVIIYVSDTDTIMTAKEHMHYKVIYETTESQFVSLSESEQTQLRNLHSYNGTTHINIDSGEVECGIKVAYKQKK